MLELLGAIASTALVLLKWWLDPDRRRGAAIRRTEEALRSAIRRNDMERLTQLVSEILDKSRRGRK